MNAAAILASIQSEGLSLALDPPGNLLLRGDRETRARWLPEVRAHKAALLALLRQPAPVVEASLEPAARLWLIVLQDGSRFSSSFTPPATAAEVRAWYPGAQVEVEQDQGGTP